MTFYTNRPPKKLSIEELKQGCFIPWCENFVVVFSYKFLVVRRMIDLRSINITPRLNNC